MSISDSDLNKGNLPSVDDYILSSDDLPSVEESININLPSVDDFIVEDFKEEQSVEDNLPSVQDFLVEEEIEESLEDISEEVITEEYISTEDLILMIEDVRKNIPEIPEVRYYEKPLLELNEKINLLPEVKYYDSEIETLYENLQDIKSSIPEVPEWVNEEFYSSLLESISSFKGDINFILDKLEVIKFESKVDNKTLDDKIEEYNNFKDDVYGNIEILSKDLISLSKSIKNSEQKILESIPEVPEPHEIKYYDKDIELLKDSISSLNEKILEIKIPEIPDFPKLPKIKYYDEDIKNIYNNIKDLNERIKITEEKLEESQTIKEEIKEDPLTNTNFATLDDLKKHYTLFINRIQKQLETIGGGGETRLEFLDDIDRTSAKTDGYVLSYQASTDKFIGVPMSGGGGGSGISTYADVAGIATVSQGLIGTPSIIVSSITASDASFSGNVSIAGTVTYEDVTNVDSVGVITARSDVIVQQNLSVAGVATFNTLSGVGTVYVGLGSTALYVDGNARVTGILTVGKASITIDGDNNTITAGDVFITGSSITIGDNVTINTGATGINSAPNVIYVAKDGDDSKNGTSIDNAKLTIAGAVSVAQTGTIIKVLSGTYNENNPITVPSFVSIVGDNLKTVTVIPNNSTQDIFHVNKGTYLANMTFVGHTAPSAAVAFPPTGATNVGGGSWESPYVQNCTSNTTTGTGMRIDGNLAEGLKSMVVDSYTQYNQGGVGIAVTNNGYAQLVSVFTICCNEGITAYKGGQCSLTNSNTDFGTYGLVADGVSNLQFTGIVTTSASAGTDRIAVAINTTTRPYEGQVLYFGTLYYTVESITVTNGGSGYTSTPSVTLSTPSGPNGSTATAFATLDDDRVSTITIISSGSQYTSAPSVTISAPDTGVTATATVNVSPIYYTINSSTPVVSGITTITIDENLNNTVGVGSTAYFYQVSTITASSHTFEYVGSGNDIATAVPLRGGVAVQENEVISRNGGRVVFTSTDQAGNFRIGDGIIINQNNGTISGRAFTRSLFNQMTPFILALS